jgi:hypothetical protein
MPVDVAAQVTAGVETNSLTDATLRTELRLRRPDGSPVMAARTGPPGFADESGQFRSVSETAIQTANQRWDLLRARIPYRALDPPPGREYPLVLRFGIGAGRLQAYSEEAFTVPAAVSPYDGK